MRSGKGKFTHHNGDVYEGDWKDDMRHGHGEDSMHSGETYAGQWRKDRRSGKGSGKMFRGFPPKFDHFYEGQWSNGAASGSGRATYANGDTYEGTFLKGERHGHGVLLTAVGER